jgi:hypothetical protein
MSKQQFDNLDCASFVIRQPHERRGASFQEQSRERLALRVRWGVVLAISDDPAERSVAVLMRSGFEVIVRVRPMVQQQARDGDGIVAGCGYRKSSVAQV